MNINIDGLNIFYRVEGSGNNLILLHGWGVSSDSLYPILNYLKRSYKVYALDLPGFGRSDIPKSSFDGENYKNIVLKFIKELNINDYVIIGHSFGGRIGIRISRENNPNLKGLILIDSAGIRDKKSLKQKLSEGLFKLIKRVVLKIFKKEKGEKILDFFRNILGSIDYKSQKGILRETLVKIVNEDLKPFLKDIKVKTLIIWGEKDRDLPLRHAFIFKNLIKNSKLIIIKDGSHYPFLENLTKVLNSIELFLRDVYNENNQ